MILHHFTSKLHLPAILKSQALVRTESNLSGTCSHYGDDVVWLLDTPKVEHDHGLGRSAVDKTEVRITIDVPKPWCARWVRWARMRGIDPRWRDSVVRVGGGLEAAKMWWICFYPIRSVYWVEIVNAHTGEQLWTRKEEK